MAERGEHRLEALREQARRGAQLDGGVGRIDGGPLPRHVSGRQGTQPAYFGRPLIKPPVWTWEIPLYFFIGGLSGGAAILGACGYFTGHSRELVLASLWTASITAMIAPVLLVMDLGRPRRFLHMLRIFKPQSPMSVGAWILSAYGGVVFLATISMQFEVALAGAVLLVLAMPLGAALSTYTGVLIGVTAVPVWFIHRRLLPLHFGIAAIGSAGAVLELLGFRLMPLQIVGFTAAASEMLVGLWIEVRRHGAADRAARQGRSGLMLRAAGIAAGPLALGLRAFGLVWPAALAFVSGALLARYGWMAAGRASAKDPEAVLATQL